MISKKSNILKIAIAFGLVLVLNWLSGLVQCRVDLTEEKRYTLADITENFLEEKIDEKLKIYLYLEGSANSGFRRLEKSTLSMLQQFRNINKKQISFIHVQISELKSDEQAKIVADLNKMNLLPMNVVEEDANGNRSEKAVYPWAVVEYKGKSYPVKLLENVSNRNGAQNLNSSIENLEYKLIEAVRLLSDDKSRRIAFLEGHGELGETETYDITTALSQYYSVDRGVIGQDASILNAYESVIIAGPTEKFSREDKFVLDQYLMNGGKLMWLVDGVQMSMDSLTKAEKNYGIYNDVNVDDILFRYGVRINPTLIQDMQCALYPVNVATVGEAARFQPLPWFYAPLLMPNAKHPISKNISNVKSEFASTIEFVGSNDKVKKTKLLSSSVQSRVMNVPMEIDLSESVQNLKVEDFTSGSQMVGVLLEGQFSSLFANRGIPAGITDIEKVRKESEPTKMIVISDGDLIRNEVRGYGEEMSIVPLGYDYASNQTIFGNKDFLLNAINYLTDDNGWYTLRQRYIKLRLLDKKEIKRRSFYRLINVGGPLLLTLVVSGMILYLRKRKYASK